MFLKLPFAVSFSVLYIYIYRHTYVCIEIYINNYNNTILYS